MHIWLRILFTSAIFICAHAAAQPAGASREITPEAEKAMRKIGSALRKMKGYEVEMNVVTRAAIGGGRYREFEGKIDYAVVPPDELFAHVRGAGIERMVYYDGKTLTVHAPAQNRYALIEAPGSIATFREQVKQAKGLELPIADLFAWGKEKGPVSSIDEGRYAGTGMIAGRSCEHYTFTGAGVIWEVWADSRDLPCKIGMVDSTDPGLPGYSAEITWTASRGKVAVPRFVADAGLNRVELAEISDSDTP